MSLKIVQEEKSSQEVKRIYEEIKDTLAVSDVGVLFKALALQPKLLETVWRVIKPNAASFAFAKDADLLKQESLEGMGKIYHPYDYLPQILDVTLPRSEVVDIDDLLTFYLYLTSRNLILNVSLERTIQGEVVGAKDAEVETFNKESPFREKLFRLVSTDESIKVAETYEGIRASLRVSIVDDPYRALANWLDYLVVAWADLRPFTETGDYRKEEERIFYLASNLTRDLPFELDLTKKDLTETAETIKSLRRVFLTSMLNVSAFKVALDRAVI